MTEIVIAAAARTPVGAFNGAFADLEASELGKVKRIPGMRVVTAQGEETTEDILRFASVSEEERLRGSTMGAIRSRLPWLTLNFVTLSMAADYTGHRLCRCPNQLESGHTNKK